MITFDHLKLIAGDPVEMKRFRTLLLEGEVGVLREAGFLHENDGSCCAREPWSNTWDRITTAVRAPVPVLSLNIDHTEDQSIRRADR